MSVCPSVRVSAVRARRAGLTPLSCSGAHRQPKRPAGPLAVQTEEPPGALSPLSPGESDQCAGESPCRLQPGYDQPGLFPGKRHRARGGTPPPPPGEGGPPAPGPLRGDRRGRPGARLSLPGARLGSAPPGPRARLSPAGAAPGSGPPRTESGGLGAPFLIELIAPEHLISSPVRESFNCYPSPLPGQGRGEQFHGL